MTDEPEEPWRRQQRAALIAARQTLSSGERKAAADIIGARLTRLTTALQSTTIGIYWPIRNEINLLHWARSLAHNPAVTLCLPVVVIPKEPLEYWRWTPGEPTRPGVWNIPSPVRRELLMPDLVLAPLVGFDLEKYRLGYGGGYFDRTLASSNPRPIAIGVGYDFSALETIFPEPHDIPMHAILTEQREILPPEWANHAA